MELCITQENVAMMHDRLGNFAKSLEQFRGILAMQATLKLAGGQGVPAHREYPVHRGIAHALTGMEQWAEALVEHEEALEIMLLSDFPKVLFTVQLPTRILP